MGQNFVKSIEEINWERTENLKETSIQYKCLLFNFYTNIEKTSSNVKYIIHPRSKQEQNKPFSCPSPLSSLRSFLSKKILCPQMLTHIKIQEIKHYACYACRLVGNVCIKLKYNCNRIQCPSHWRWRMTTGLLYKKNWGQNIMYLIS